MQKKTAAAILIAVSFVAAHVCFFVQPQVFEAWNLHVIDQLFLYRSSCAALSPAYDPTVVHVDLNDSTIQQLDNYYLDRSYFAQVIRNLAQMGTALQAYDFIFAARSEPGSDRKVIEATAGAGRVFFGLAFELNEKPAVQASGRKRRGHPGHEDSLQYIESSSWKLEIQGEPSSLYAGEYPLTTFSSLAEASRGLGFISVKADRDGVFRRTPLLARYKDSYYPSLPFRVACEYLSVPPERIRIKPGEAIVLEQACRPGGTPHDIFIPIDGRGNMIVNFIGPWERMKHYSFADVFRASESRDDMESWRDELQGKIVLVSDVSSMSNDLGPVPTDVNLPLSGLHANVLHTILTEEFLRELPASAMLTIELSLTAVLLILALRFSSLGLSLGTFALAAVYLAGTAVLFFWAHIIVHVVRPLFIIGFSLILVTGYRFFHEEKEKAALRRSFEAYFPPAVVDKIMANPESIASSGQRKELTVLFSDIKSFSTYSSVMPPDAIREYLNEYFEAMVDIVFKYQGTVDKFIGDGLMVFFGDPEPQPDHALRCVRAAVEMQREVRRLKQKWEKREGAFPIQIRIGINTGEVVVGNMGSSRRLSYTVLGSEVNLAQRLESNAPVEGILVSKRTYDLVKDHVPVRSMGEIRVKGLSDPVTVFEIPVDGKEIASNLPLPAILA